MTKQPFIAISEFSVKKVSSGAFARFLNWIGKSARTKCQFLNKYFEYSLCCSKERWLRFIKDICEWNGFVYDEDEWSFAYDEWKSKGCSYSVHFF